MTSGSLQFQDPTTPPGARCAYCFHAVGEGPRTSCAKCRALYHQECWKANDSRCAVYGCHRVAAPPAVHAELRRAYRRHQLAGGLILSAIVGLIVVGFVASGKDRPPHPGNERMGRIQQTVKYVALATNKQTEGDLDGALHLYTMAIDLKTESAIPYHNRAVVRVLKGDPAGAEADYSRALELDPAYATAWRGRGHVRSRRGDLDGAIADCTRAIELKPDDVRAYQYRAAAKHGKGDYVGALQDHNHALLDLRGRDAAGFANRAMTFKAQGDFDGALSDLNRAVDLDPAAAGPYHDRGHLKTELQDLDGAIEDFTRAFQRAPANPEPLFDRACRWYELRDWKQSRNDFDEVSRIHPDSRDRARLRIFLIQCRAGSRSEATSQLAEYLAWRDFKDAWTTDLVRFACGRLKEQALLAAAAPVDTAEARGRRCEAYFYAGTLRLLAGDRGTAWRYFTTCVETGATSNSEYFGAVAELRFLGSDD